jgi:hypothetical protein
VVSGAHLEFTSGKRFFAVGAPCGVGVPNQRWITDPGISDINAGRLLMRNVGLVRPRTKFSALFLMRKETDGVKIRNPWAE